MTATKTTSDQLHAALVAKGYRRLTTRYVQPDNGHYRQLDYYFHADKGQEAVLERVFVRESEEEEEACELRIPVSNTNDIAAIVAAIP